MWGWGVDSYERRGAPSRLLALSALALFAALALTTVGGADLSPRQATFVIPPGTGMSETNKVVNLPQFPGHADIEIAIDTTGSMSTGIADAVAEANDIVSQVQAEVPDSDFSVVQFRDAGDSPEYLVMQSMTPSANKVENALSLLGAGQGGDPPEAYNLVFHNSYADPANTIGWRDGTRKFVVVIGDAQPHGAVQSDGFPNCADVSADPHGLDTATELAGMKNAQRTLLMIFEDDAGATTNLGCYQDLAAAAYPIGNAVSENGSGLAQDIIDLINASVAVVQNVHLEVDQAGPSPADASWITLPPALGPISAPGMYQFGPIGINVPAGTPPGTYKFDLVALADGVDVGHELITVVVPQTTGLVICKNVTDPSLNGTAFNFTVLKGTTTVGTVSVPAGTCSNPVPGTTTATNAATYTVKEDLAGGTYNVTAITSSPTTALVTKNLAKGTAKVTVTPGTVVTTSFTNVKNTSTIQVCKWSASDAVIGKQHTFTVGGSTVKVKAGGPTRADAVCSTPAPATSGTSVVVAETIPTGEKVASITAGAPAKLVSSNLSAGTAKVKLGTGANAVYFEDEPQAQTVIFQVCKDSTNGLTGSFTFNVDDHHGHVYSGDDAVVVPVGGCEPVAVSPGTVDVSELGPQTNFNLSSIRTVPDSALVSSSIDQTRQNAIAGTAQVAVPQSGSVQVHFVNDKLLLGSGTIEICKNVVDPLTHLPIHTYDGTDFVFTVDGDPQQYTVAAGRCSSPIPVPLTRFGTTQITELTTPGFQIDSVTERPSDSDTAVDITGNPVTVQVSATSPETIVTFNNKPLTAAIKICKRISSGSEAALSSLTFDFTVTINGQQLPTVHVPAGSCKLLSNVIKLVDGQGNPATVTVQEALGNYTGVGSVVGGTNAHYDASTQTLSFSPGPGTNVVTFVNTAGAAAIG